jgi:uncharacterized metal-binding protein YceD (DUF177 family)
MTAAMSGPLPELHRPLALDRIPPHGFETEITATAQECEALAARLRIPAVEALSCRFRLHKLPGGAVAADGGLHARVVQTCVVTLDDFPAEIDEAFRVRFVPAGTETDEEDLTADPESDDEIPYEGVFIDLGEAAAEQLALTLDPYPRSPGAVLPEAAADPGLLPFSLLAALRRKN